MSFPRYPKYKESGVEWLGAVPSHWVVKRLRQVARLNPNKSETATLARSTEVTFLPMEAIGEGGALLLDRLRPIGELESGYTYFAEGDVAIAKITPCFENGKGAVMRGLHGGLGFGTTELIVARPHPQLLDSAYLHRIFTSRPFMQQGEASMYGAGGQKRVPDDFVRDFAIALPPLDEQVAIREFLDCETTKIDALVAEQEQLISLLKEKRQAVISHAVTKGLDPSVPMKDSGVEWLGQVPRNWRIARLGNLFFDVDERGSEELPVLSVSIHNGVSDSELDESELDRKVTRSEDRSKYKRVIPHDLVYNMMRAWQGGFGTVEVEGMVSPAYVVARPRFDTSTFFVEQLLRTAPAIEEIRRHSRGVTDFRLRLYWDEFKNLVVAVPTSDEASRICDHIKGEVERFDSVMDAAHSLIGQLVERRSALISAAVTGQIDVRGLQ